MFFFEMEFHVLHVCAVGSCLLASSRHSPSLATFPSFHAPGMIHFRVPLTLIQTSSGLVPFAEF